MLLEIGIALILAKLIGALFERLHQPTVIGEILAGIVMGPFILGAVFDVDYVSAETGGIAQIGIILLLFISGLEIGIEEIRTAGKAGLVTALFGVAFAFLFGFLVGAAMGYDLVVGIAIGNIFVATSVGITVKTLMDMHALHSRVGELILTAAVLDDLFGVIILSVSLGSGHPEMLSLKIVLFFALFIGALLFINRVKEKKMHIPRLVITMAIATALILAAVAEELGFAAVTGSFFAGLLFSRMPQKRRIIEFSRGLGEIFFIPLFFVWVGASFDFNTREDVGMLVLLFIPLAFLAKILGCGLGARLVSFTGRDALAVGIGMVPRMEVALVVVSTIITMGVLPSTELENQMLAATILLVILSSIVTPVLLKAVFRERTTDDAA
jgi:Kef-type K+ transport system membrane component KefB